MIPFFGPSIALNEASKAKTLIDRTEQSQNPFDEKYSKVEGANWEACANVIDPLTVRDLLRKAW